MDGISERTIVNLPATPYATGAAIGGDSGITSALLLSSLIGNGLNKGIGDCCPQPAEARDVYAVLSGQSEIRQDIGEAKYKTAELNADIRTQLGNAIADVRRESSDHAAQVRFEAAENIGMTRMDIRSAEANIRADVLRGECNVRADVAKSTCDLMAELKEGQCDIKGAVKDNAIMLKDTMFAGFLGLRDHLDCKIERLEQGQDDIKEAIRATECNILARLAEDENQRLRDRLARLEKDCDHNNILQSVVSNFQTVLNNSALLGSNQRNIQVGQGNLAGQANLPTNVNG